MPHLTRVSGYTHLGVADLVPPPSEGIFFEPADTETGAWVGHDLLTPGCGLLDLGSGSGAAAAAMSRSGAGHVHGIDASADSVAWADKHHAADRTGARVTFARADFSLLDSLRLLATAPRPLPRPLVVTSNPPYVPMTEEVEAAEGKRSISAGADGLRWAPVIIAHARALRCDLGLTIGSYSSPATAVEMLRDAGFRIRTVTLCPLDLGDFTVRHIERTATLEERGEAVLWRREDEPPAYFITGLACRWTGSGRAQTPETPDELTGEGLMDLLRTAARSSTPRLETLDDTGADLWPGAVRVVDLPTADHRNHW
ncbi:methyltransferase domain-containing protein [Streptomyces alboniger]|uniref:Methyltransferase domain-containing protein n=1 Tax=Streptomyces alboniger TaxID=132473 RepID=A0A5J6H843_STRAD|nr:methyltransferase domain-containing protein [Streptomyces alboniger]QEV16256.1 methyltransferase domain-containing protein [Streptomyces alboniger]